jgi:hypothetical protein
MKKVLLVTGLIFILILICTFMLSAQVSSWRSNPPQQKTETPRVQPSVSQQNNVSRWRTQTAPIRPGDKYELPQSTRRVRVQNWGRPNPYGYYWSNWGWYQPFPYIWYDDFGWRQRSVIHVYENGRRDTIKKESVYTSFGIGHTNNKQSSFWGAVGRKKGYFILDYTMSYDIDQNKFYPNGRINEVDFPLSKNDFIKEGTLYFGGGKRFGKLGVHGMIGFGNENIRYQGKDDLGGISFPKSNSNFTTLKFGIIRDFNFFTLKLDRDPIRNFNQISIGLHNK